jgi:hypothetical protein
MITAPKRKSVVFATLGICLVAVAVALNVSWIVINWREGLLLALGLILFLWSSRASSSTRFSWSAKCGAASSTTRSSTR